MTTPKRYAVTDTKTGKRIPSATPKASMGELQTTKAKTLTGGSGNTPPSKGVSTGSSGSRDVAVRGSRSVATSNPSSNASRTMKDVQGERVGPKSLSSSSKTAEITKKAGRLGTLGKAASLIGMATYSKDAGEGSDFKGTDKRPEAWSGFKKETAPTTSSSASKPTASSSTSKPTTSSTASNPTASSSAVRAPRESGESRSSRQAAYDNWVKSNRDPMSQLAKDRGVLTSSNTPSGSPVTMKSGGSVKSKIDGIAQRGKTRGKWV